MAAITKLLPNLDRLLRDAVERARHLFHAGEDSDRREEFRGLYISESEIDSLVDRTETIGNAESAVDFIDACSQLPGSEIFSRLGLSDFDQAVLLIAAAPDLDLRYERIYAYLQDDVSRRKPTVNLALDLLSRDAAEKLLNRARFSTDAPLVQSGLLRLQPDPAQAEPPLLAFYLKADDSAVRLLSGDDALDPRLAGFTTLERRVPAPQPDPAIPERLAVYVTTVCKQKRSARLLFSGPLVGVKDNAARTTASVLQLPLLTADLDRHPKWRSDAPAVATLLTRQAFQESAVLFLKGLGSSDDLPAVQAFLKVLVQYDGVTIISSTHSAVARELSDLGFLSIDFPASDFSTRRLLWQKEVAAAGLYASPDAVTTLAGSFSHEAEEIHAAVESARQRVEWLSSTTQRPAQAEVEQELLRAARAQSDAELASLTSRIQPMYRMSDLVLPQDACDQLDEICQRVVHRQEVLESGGFGKKLSAGKGIPVLFSGPSGTGKTMAAEVIANRVGLDLFRIDLSTTLSKWIGETEQNLERIFNSAARSNAVLLFDEGDALFGKRTPTASSHDRFANIEVSYLLQKMDEYEGVTILTTNLQGNMDPALVRRLAFTVHFPFPSEADRSVIWKQIWPKQTRLDPELDFQQLAKHFKLSGGNIKNVALSAAFLAAGQSRPVNLSDILHAVRREYEKVGKVISTSEMEVALQHA